MNITEVENLLEKFNTLPKSVRPKSFLEICKYPGSRFEEVCSRILAFYLDPNEEHGLQNLLLKSLFSALNREFPLTKTVKITEEAYAEGKRIDLVIEMDDTVIGIENKISAELYNPLEIYWKKLKEYNKETAIGIVLSVNPIYGSGIKKMEDNNFIAVLYKEWFDRIKQNLGSYYRNDKLEYIAYLNDFISTIENMGNDSHLNDKLREFFFENSDKIIQLRGLHEKFNRENKNKVNERLSVIKELVQKEGEDWGIWEGYLMYKIEVVEGYKIGISLEFETRDFNPCKIPIIYFSSWSEGKSPNGWDIYKAKFRKKFNSELGEQDDKLIMLETVNTSDDKILSEKIAEYVKAVNEITEP